MAKKIIKKKKAAPKEPDYVVTDKIGEEFLKKNKLEAFIMIVVSKDGTGTHTETRAIGNVSGYVPVFHKKIALLHEKFEVIGPIAEMMSELKNLVKK